MRKLQAFLLFSADGYFRGPGGDLSWTRHSQHPEGKQWADENAYRDSVLVFCRTTYQTMSPHLQERQGLLI